MKVLAFIGSVLCFVFLFLALYGTAIRNGAFICAAVPIGAVGYVMAVVGWIKGEKK